MPMSTTEITEPGNKLAALIHDGNPKRAIFDPISSPDGLNQKWIALREAFSMAGYQLVTEDDLRGRSPDFEVHVNARKTRTSRHAFVVLSECGQVFRPNADLSLLRSYEKIFTWNEDLFGLENAIKIHLAHPLGSPPVDGYSTRDRLLVMIAANKSLPNRNPKHDLYAERTRAIRWFESNAPGDFVLYGAGWEKSPRIPTRLGGVIHRIESLFPRKRVWFPSWAGSVERKVDVLVNARFSLVYENVRGLRGYITEKIFDAFCAGNVPVYWGAENVDSYLSPDCYIDRRQYKGYSDLYHYLRMMPEWRYRKYQEAIRGFLESEAGQKFSITNFSETIVNEVKHSVGKG